MISLKNMTISFSPVLRLCIFPSLRITACIPVVEMGIPVARGSYCTSCLLQKIQEQRAMCLLPRTTCQNSSMCCIPAALDSPSLWTDYEKVQPFLTSWNVNTAYGNTDVIGSCQSNSIVMEIFSQTEGKWPAIVLTVFNPLTQFVWEESHLLFLSVSGLFFILSRQPLHPGECHVSLWANCGSPPGFLNATSGPAVSPPPACSACWTRH